jgi:transposase-like protein
MFLFGTGFKVQASEIIIREKEGFEYVIDETVIKVGPEYVWIWIATIEAENKEILGISISKEQNMFVTERFLSDVVENMENIQFHQMVVLVSSSMQILEDKPSSSLFL